MGIYWSSVLLPTKLLNFHANYRRRPVMRAFFLFELFLVLFACYVNIHYEGGERVLILVFCSVTVLLFEVLRARRKKDWTIRKVFFPTNYHAIDFHKKCLK